MSSMPNTKHKLRRRSMKIEDRESSSDSCQETYSEEDEPEIPPNAVTAFLASASSSASSFVSSAASSSASSVAQPSLQARKKTTPARRGFSQSGESDSDAREEGQEGPTTMHKTLPELSDLA